MQRLELQSALTQFRARYPAGSLTAELLQIHTHHYVVRAEVQIGGLTIASGMAAAAQIELAEDQARLRALAVVGIQPELATPTLAPSTLPVVQRPPILATPEAVLSATALPTGLPSTQTTEASLPTSLSVVSATPIAPNLPTPTSPTSPIPLTDLPTVKPDNSHPKPDKVPPPSLDEANPIEEASPPDLDSDWPPNWDSELELPPDSDFASDPKPDLEPSPKLDEDVNSEQIAAPSSKATSGNGKPIARSQKANPEKSPPSDLSQNQEPVDFSDPIAQIDTEMMRVGWTKEQGRDHLKKTYKKRSRQQLSDEELLDFLSHLKSLPSSSQTPF
jgi:hypothetical protein